MWGTGLHFLCFDWTAGGQSCTACKTRKKEMQKNKQGTRSTDTNVDSQSMIKNITRKQTFGLLLCHPKVWERIQLGIVSTSRGSISISSKLLAFAETRGKWRSVNNILLLQSALLLELKEVLAMICGQNIWINHSALSPFPKLKKELRTNYAFM